MGRDNHPRMRQAEQLRRRVSRREPYDRILIVCEGSKTEPLYFKEIQQLYRLNTANITVRPSLLGTTPSQVVEYAQQLFTNGDPHHHIVRKTFERVYAVFDRDDHINYHDALATAQRLNGSLRNDERQPIVFEAVASIPSFELWLLIHFVEIHHPIHRNDVMTQLKTHLPTYHKGQSDNFAKTKDSLQKAFEYAERLLAKNNPENDDPYTAVGRLVNLLTTLKPL